MWTIVDALAFAGGFASCWYVKDKLIQSVRGTDAFVKSLEAKLTALKATL